MHVVVTFKVHSNCLKTIKIQMSYLFIYTLQQEMKLQTWCSCGSGILPGSWGTGHSVPGCRGITCSERLRMGRKKEGRVLWTKALCDIISLSCARTGPRMVLGWQNNAGVKGIFVKDTFIAPKLHRSEGAGAAPGWETWDNWTEGVTLHVPVLPVISSACLRSSARAMAASSPRAAFLEALQCELPWPSVCSSQLPETPVLNPSVVPFWLDKGAAGLQWQDLHSLFAGWIFWVPAISHIKSAFPKVGLFLGDSPAEHQRS